MTDNRALAEDGKEAVYINRSDGLAIGEIKKLGINQIIISMEANPIVGMRATKLGIPVMQAVENKRDAVEKYLKINNIHLHPDHVAFIGNDLNDKLAMEYVGWPLAPADAYVEVKSIAKIVLNTGAF